MVEQPWPEYISAFELFCINILENCQIGALTTLFSGCRPHNGLGPGDNLWEWKAFEEEINPRLHLLQP